MSDQQTNLLLVGEVEKHPTLYNFHLPDYSKKHETDIAWEEVGKVVKLTAAECKDRWRNIKAVFARHLKPPKSGSCSKGRKAYYLFDAMQFTVPYNKSLQRTTGNLQEEEGISAGNGNMAVMCDDLQPETLLSAPSSPLRPKLSSCSSTSTAGLPQHSDHHPEPGKHHVTQKKRSMDDDVDEAHLECFNCKKAKDEKSVADSRTEALKMFLLSMLPDLIKMDDREVRQFKRKALDIVDDIMLAKSSRDASSSL